MGLSGDGEEWKTADEKDEDDMKLEKPGREGWDVRENASGGGGCS